MTTPYLARLLLCLPLLEGLLMVGRVEQGAVGRMGAKLEAKATLRRRRGARGLLLRHAHHTALEFTV